MFRLLTAAAFVGMITLSGPAAAQEPSMDSCARDYESCVDACAQRHQDDAARAGCIARCASGRVSCEAEAGYEQAKPWLREQFQKLEDFLRGFRDGPPPASGDPDHVDL